ncbi:hypothetical protein BDV93DRAFT_526306 [Ceratobasidium sp. AG-I]|nr:hypothetical protein BDV93DRAFT_526306 [Ceratobasidium sp. AG-I]
MPRISNIVPLPGVSELESLARGFVSRLKDADFENNKRAILAKKLERLLEHSRKLGIPTELTSQLLEIQRQFQAADDSGSRLRVRSAEHKLALWDDLSARLDEAMAVSTHDLVAQMQQARIQQAQVLQPQLHIAITHLRQSKVKIVNSYDITDQVEIPSEGLIQGFERVKTTLRASRFGRLPVAYMTCVSDSRDVAHEVVEQELNHISQSLHVNVAQLVGATEGNDGLNGIIVVMDGVHLNDFVRGAHSGAVWAKCIRGCNAFLSSFPGSMLVRSMTVAPDGHVTIFPISSATSESSGILPHFAFWSYNVTDSAASLLFSVILGNLVRGASIDWFSELGPAFTVFQVMKLADSIGLLPKTRSHSFGDERDPNPPFQPRVGELGRATYHQGDLEGWESLGISRDLRDRRHIFSSRGPASPDVHEFSASGANDWVTATFYSHQKSASCIVEYYRSERSEGFSWRDVFNEARDISRRLTIDIDSIALCYRIDYTVWITLMDNPGWSEETNWVMFPQILYYHRSPLSSDPQEVEGFFSTSETPDCGEWEDKQRQQGWTLTFEMDISTYCMGDDWGLRYQKTLQNSMATMPGSYPQHAYIES